MQPTLLLLVLMAGAQPTDFGVRTVGQSAARVAPESEQAQAPLPSPAAPTLKAAALIGARFGRVTSTVRSREHNRRVGGAENSWHLYGRAIDIARHPTVSHWQIAAELRRSGFNLIESLDEGDHSHFAFSDRPVPPGRQRSSTDQIAELRQEASYFRFVAVPTKRRAEARSSRRAALR
jgi:hypothetical protein